MIQTSITHTGRAGGFEGRGSGEKRDHKGTPPLPDPWLHHTPLLSQRGRVWGALQVGPPDINKKKPGVGCLSGLREAEVLLAK